MKELSAPWNNVACTAFQSSKSEWKKSMYHKTCKMCHHPTIISRVHVHHRLHDCIEYEWGQWYTVACKALSSSGWTERRMALATTTACLNSVESKMNQFKVVWVIVSLHMWTSHATFSSTYCTVEKPFQIHTSCNDGQGPLLLTYVLMWFPAWISKLHPL